MWETWKVFPELTGALLAVSSQPALIPHDVMAIIERYFVLVYDRTSNLTSVNAARKRLFCKHTRMLDIPPTAAALEQHVRRTIIQGGHTWAQALVLQMVLPDPSEWGWQKCEGRGWDPCWTTRGQAQDLCLELIACKCKKACHGNCRCSKANFQCTILCFCEGNCFEEDPEVE